MYRVRIVRIVAVHSDDCTRPVLEGLEQSDLEGTAQALEFQVLLCRFGARIIDARAAVARSADHDGSQVIEVEYNVDFGPFLSKVASPFLPKLSFWFDPKSPGTWVGHRIPLYSKGPTVVVMRTGFTPGAIVVGP